MNGGATGGVSQNEDVMQYYMCPYCGNHIPSAEVISHHQTHHKHQPEPRIQYVDPEVKPSPPPPPPPPYGLTPNPVQDQPCIQYTNPQMGPLIYGLAPNHANVRIKPSRPLLHGSASGSAQQQPPHIHYMNRSSQPPPPYGLAPNLGQGPRIQSVNAQMRPSPTPLHGFTPYIAQKQPPRIQSTNAQILPSPPLHGFLAPNPRIQYPTPLYGLAPTSGQTAVPSPGESSSGKIASNNNSGKQTARFRYQPYPRPEKPKYNPPPFDLNVLYLGIPLSMRQTSPPVVDAPKGNTSVGDGPPALNARRENTSNGDGPPVLDARGENTPAGAGPPVLVARRENTSVGDGVAGIRGSSRVRQPVIAIFSSFFEGNFMGWCSHPNRFFV